MKSSKLLLIIFFLACIAKANAQTADEIIDKHIKAIGGKDAWKKITSMRQEAVVDNNGTEINIDFVAVQNKGFRQTVSLAGLSGYSITTPDSGWQFYPWQGHLKPEAMTPEQVKESADNLDLQGPLIDYKEKGHSLEYNGTDDFEGTECYKLKLTEKSGKVITYYIDPANYFIIHTVTVSKANGQEREQPTDYSNYKKLPEGIWVPLNIGTALKIKKIEINPVTDENIFKPSAK